MSRVVHPAAQDYSLGASTARDYVANGLQILEAVIRELRTERGEPFLPGMQDDLLGVRTRLQYALTILDRRP